ncbi:PaaI family thioesterase [Variovorax sp. J22R133]|uniref:PaaI family thioesterase n=1 Tax=Variovorax brevis TaxID=3053503 RepID=UPI002578C52D|nr:PaaI family thioesterase [Variovorax sp. J22R133]MDM0116515.1 PaaI family thioesterase [Variovorax sp. J22R133]
MNDFAHEPLGLLFGLPMPMAQAFGLRGESIGGMQATVRMPRNDMHTNSRGDVHGGALAVLLDCTLASAARAHAPTRFGVITVDMALHFVAPCDGDIIGSATCERRGRSLCFVRGEARNEQGDLLALATGTFKLVERSPTSN